jgi:hypothetical protein
MRKRYANNPTKDANFLFETVMCNVGFKLNFPISKCKSNALLNNEVYRHSVELSQCETTSATHVNIKLVSQRPENFMFYVLSYPGADVTDPFFFKTPQRLYARKPEEEFSEVTLILFASSQTILTGRYVEDRKKTYEFFIKMAIDNKEEIREKVCRPKVSLSQFSKSFRDGTLTY